MLGSSQNKLNPTSQTRRLFRTRLGVLLSILLLSIPVCAWAFWKRETAYEPMKDISEPPGEGVYRPYDPGTAVYEPVDSKMLKSMQKKMDSRQSAN